MNGPILITGARGFVGRHLLSLLDDRAVPAEADVTDADAMTAEIRAVSPAAVVHLAALPSVASSWGDSTEVWRVNCLGTVTLLDAVRASAPGARVLAVSTGEVYGRAPVVPTPEHVRLAPLSPYAASKAAAEIACERAARADDLDVVVARSFAHSGPGQDERFAVASWTRQIALLEAAGGGVLHVGNLSSRRDLTDVRDVCRAYRLLLEPDVPSGVYNVASGTAVAMGDVADLLVSMARCPVRVKVEEPRLRPGDLPIVCGDPSRLSEATGWKPEIPLEQTLADVLEDARRLVSDDKIAAR